VTYSAAGGSTAAASRVSPSIRWTVIDQGISSASNLLFVVTVARTSNVEKFGTFFLAYMAYGLLLGAGRAIGGDILLLRAEQQPADLERDSRRLLGIALTHGLLGGLVACSISPLVGGTLEGVLLGLGVALPFLFLQDALRYCLFARRRPALAAANDLIWLAVQVVATVVLLQTVPEPGPASIVLAWASGAVVAVGAGLWQAWLIPTLRGLPAWFTQDRARVSSFFVSSFFGDFAMNSSSSYASAYLIAAIGRVTDVAAVRGGMLLFAPLDALFMAVRLVTLPTLARSVPLGGFQLRRHARLVAVVSVALTAAWAVAVLSLPAEAGRAALGASWAVVTPILLPIALACAARYVALPAQAGLWALGETRSIVRIRFRVTLLVFAGVIIGTHAAGALGAASGLAVAYFMEGVLSWARFVRTCGRLPVHFPTLQIQSSQRPNKSFTGLRT
jgi:O-antigen/teichoic acid export membrane protein